MTIDFSFMVVFQGLYQKAEALYSKGEFELALVFYHRGHKLRPELQEFRLGINKAQEAIDNSVGSMYILWLCSVDSLDRRTIDVPIVPME